MNAEEYYSQVVVNADFTKLTRTGIDTDYGNIFKFAEAYRHHKLSEITDEVIDKEFKINIKQDPEENKQNVFYRVGAFWLRDKLKG